MLRVRHRAAVAYANPLYEKVGLVLLSGILYSFAIGAVSVASRQIPAATLSAFRLATASVIFAAILFRLKPEFKWHARKAFDIFLVGILNIGLPFLFLALSMNYISSSLAALLFNTTPLFTIVLAHYLLADEKLNAAKVVGTMLGVGGAAALVATNSSGLAGLHGQGWIGQTLIIIASLTGALGVIYTRMRLQEENTIVLAAGQVFGVFMVMVPLALITDGLPAAGAYSWQAWAAVLVSTVSGPVIAFWLLFYMVNKYSASLGGFASIATPVFSAALGVIFLGEAITLPIAIGVLLVLVGIGLANSA
jgi:drug/metabolite transporter (DMT)-like permease